MYMTLCDHLDLYENVMIFCEILKMNGLKF